MKTDVDEIILVLTVKAITAPRVTLHCEKSIAATGYEPTNDKTETTNKYASHLDSCKPHNDRLHNTTVQYIEYFDHNPCTH